jgi:hypothetical protein
VKFARVRFASPKFVRVRFARVKFVATNLERPGEASRKELLVRFTPVRFLPLQFTTSEHV